MQLVFSSQIRHEYLKPRPVKYNDRLTCITYAVAVDGLPTNGIELYETELCSTEMVYWHSVKFENSFQMLNDLR